MIAYFLVLLAIGFWTMRCKSNRNQSESFLAADRDMNLFHSTTSTAATDIGGGFSLAMGGLGFTLGIAGSWLVAISALSVVMASFLVVPKIKRWADRVKALTTGDLFEYRFDRRTGLTAACLIGASWFAFVGGQIIAGGKLLQATVGLELPLAVLVAGTVIVTYTAMGGLKAVIFTDAFQMTILLVGVVFILVPIGLVKVGGVEQMILFFQSSEETESMIHWGAAGWKQTLGWFLTIFPVWFISIAGFQRIIAARDERTARNAFILTGIPIEWPLFAIGSTLVGMFARMLTPELVDPELATPTMVLALLPIGLSGLVVAAYIAALMSTADSCLIGPVAIFVNDIYRKYLNPKAMDKEIVKLSRITTVVMGVCAIGIAYVFPKVLDLILYAYTFGAAGLFFPMLGLLFWKRTTATGAFWSIIAGGIGAVIWTWADQPFGFAPSYIGWALSCVTLISVSLATTHSPEEQLEDFYC